jgi:hypothetical protein
MKRFGLQSAERRIRPSRQPLESRTGGLLFVANQKVQSSARGLSPGIARGTRANCGARCADLGEP